MMRVYKWVHSTHFGFGKRTGSVIKCMHIIIMLILYIHLQFMQFDELLLYMARIVYSRRNTSIFIICICMRMYLLKYATQYKYNFIIIMHLHIHLYWGLFQTCHAPSCSGAYFRQRGELDNYRISGYFSGGGGANFSWSRSINHTPIHPGHAVASTTRHFVGKYFVVRFPTTKTTKILPLENYPLYGILLINTNQFIRQQ